MKILHLCNDLVGSKVHHNLYDHLSKQDQLSQLVFYPSRPETIEKIEKYASDRNYEIIVSKPLKKYHRFLFRRKIRYLYNDLITKTDLCSYNIIHATTLFSDGALALKIFKKFGVPFIVAVRGTDINLFIKYRKDLNGILNDILTNASRIIFISESLQNGFFKGNLSKTLLEKIKWKCVVIPNGLDDFWLNNITKKKNLRPSRFLYIGKFNKNKNVLNLIQSLKVLRESYPEITLDLVGEGGNQEKQIKYISQNQDWINFKGPVFDKSKLKKIYQSNHIFAMISLGETFGLVYVEALSQGLPILYTANQGIDGTFKFKIGEFVDPKSIGSITKGLSKILMDYDTYELDKIDFTAFQWPIIAKTYNEIYTSILE